MPLHSKAVTNRRRAPLEASVTLFGGDHPTNYPPINVSFHGVRIQTNKGSYFQQRLHKYGVPASKPPTYPGYITPRFTDVYSKGSRGLFVPSRVIGIFTDTTISLSSRLRQRPDHYTIRAGRNLPDKEFRYLRTVIVTAAVYWGFNSTLLLSMTSPLTFQHWAGVRLYTDLRFGNSPVFLLNSCPD